MKIEVDDKNKTVSMKVERLETHDRLLHVKKDQALNVSKGAEDCLKTNKLSLKLQERSPYIYVFAHPRTSDDGRTKVMFWQPRLTKPQAQTNSYLFRAKSNSDLLEVIWLLPPEDMWEQYKLGNMTEHEIVLWSVQMYTMNREHLEKKDPQDLDEKKAENIYREVIQEIRQERDSIVIKPKLDFWVPS